MAALPWQSSPWLRAGLTVGLLLLFWVYALEGASVLVAVAGAMKLLAIRKPDSLGPWVLGLSSFIAVLFYTHEPTTVALFVKPLLASAVVFLVDVLFINPSIVEEHPELQGGVKPVMGLHLYDLALFLLVQDISRHGFMKGWPEQDKWIKWTFWLTVSLASLYTSNWVLQMAEDFLNWFELS